jgi:hypothetical protein
VVQVVGGQELVLGQVQQERQLKDLQVVMVLPARHEVLVVVVLEALVALLS